jgi:hypothetical protein
MVLCPNKARPVCNGQLETNFILPFSDAILSLSYLENHFAIISRQSVLTGQLMYPLLYLFDSRLLSCIPGRTRDGSQMKTCGHLVWKRYK